MNIGNFLKKNWLVLSIILLVFVLSLIFLGFKITLGMIGGFFIGTYFGKKIFEKVGDSIEKE
tara:strand:+ start:282 stop:467 length:186 start_codon:yes stop_codon:yes gene_type:complete